MVNTKLRTDIPDAFAIAFLVSWCLSDLTRRFEQVNTNKFAIVEPDGTGQIVVWDPETASFNVPSWFNELGNNDHAGRAEREIEQLLNQLVQASFTAYSLRLESQLKLLSAHRSGDEVILSVKLETPPVVPPIADDWPTNQLL